MQQEKTVEEYRALAKQYREEAEKHQQAAKLFKKSFLKTGIFTVAAVIVLIIATSAWYVNNSRVRSKGVSLSADSASIELRTEGSAGIHDDVLKRLLGTDGEKGFWYKVANVLGIVETNYSETAVNWLLKDESHVGNYDDVQTDWESYWQDPDHQRQDYAIEPGSFGKLSFFAVPTSSGNVSAQCKLDVMAYKAGSTGFQEIAKDTIEEGFVRGHILFFLETGEGENKEILWLKDGLFDIQIDNAIAGVGYKYTLYWCWPLNFGEMILPVGDNYLNSRAPLLSNYSNGEVIRKALLYEDEDSLVKNPSLYMFSGLTQSPLQTTQPELSQIEEMYNTNSNDFTEEAKKAFVELSSYYNQADQYIGGHVDCIRIRLSLEY